MKQSTHALSPFCHALSVLPVPHVRVRSGNSSATRRKGVTHNGETCPKDDNIQGYDFARLQLDTVLDNVFYGIPLDCYVGPVQRLEVPRIDDDPFTSHSFVRVVSLCTHWPIRCGLEHTVIWSQLLHLILRRVFLDISTQQLKVLNQSPSTLHTQSQTYPFSKLQQTSVVLPEY